MENRKFPHLVRGFSQCDSECCVLSETNYILTVITKKPREKE